MKKSLFASLMVSLLMLTGCFSTGAMNSVSSIEPAPVDASMYSSKFDNIVLVMDSSSSMSQEYNGYSKFDIAQNVMAGINGAMPELDQNVIVRSFGHSTKVTKKPLMTLSEMGTYNTDAVAMGLDKLVEAGGTSPLYKTIDVLKADLKDAEGKTAVVIVTDAKDMSASKTLASAKALKAGCSSSMDICFFPVQVGDDGAGMSLMESVASLGDCGAYTNASDLMSAAAVTAYVKNNFLDEKPVVAIGDEDGDGVTDDMDKCPGTPYGVAVDSDGCPLDSDRDGVADYMDKCPGTPMGASVNSVGCWVLEELLFDFDKSVIKTAGYPHLDAVVSILKENSSMNVILEGHTDSVGPAAYNNGLSLRRSKAVSKYLVENGIDASRLTCEGFGEDKPVASNDTEEGRSLNRRVEITPVK